jgi:hypothetical protein
MSIHEHLPPEVKRELKQVGWSKGLELAKLARSRNGQEFKSANWLHKAKTLSHQEFHREVEKELNGKDSEPHELIYFKVYKSQIPVIEQAIETAAMMLGSDKSRGYCLEMICADFLAGANLDSGQPDVLLHSLSHYFQFLPGQQKQAFVQMLNGKHAVSDFLQKHVPIRVEGSEYEELRERGLRRDGWRCQFCGSRTHLEVQFRSHLGEDVESNLITFCYDCQASCHGGRLQHRTWLSTVRVSIAVVSRRVPNFGHM